MGEEPLWRPSEARVAASHMHAFLERNAAKLSGRDYAALHTWSVTRPEEFWDAVWDYCRVEARTPYHRVVENFDRMPGARWFDGAELNYAENLIGTPRGGSQPSGTALVFANERGDRRALDREALRGQVASVAAAMRERGVEPGDRVAAVLPNVPETVVAALAAASVGAVWSSCSPDFGPRAVLDRFSQIAPKWLFVADGYHYGGRRIATLESVARMLQRLPSVETLVVVPYLDGDPFAAIGLEGLEPREPAGRGPAVLSYAAVASAVAPLEFAPLPFSHPLSILYSSGTTGVPKGIVHGAGGTLLQHRKEHVLHTDIHAGDVVFYYTTCGWMMWNWLLSALASGARLLLYDGAPLHPDPGVLWRIAERESVNVFGTSAGYLRALANAGYRPREHVALPRLRSILSTGSPLAPGDFDDVYARIKDDVQLASISGGTDIVSCFALGNPMLPVYRGELQCRGLGMRVEIFDESGRAVRGAKGELVCTAPFPSMPVAFWNDPDGARYRAAYFERFPGVWYHGDYAELTERDGLVIYGRSDAVLNPGGVRIGTGELYRVVEREPEIAESVAVGQDWRGDTRVVLFVRLQPGARLDDNLRARLRAAIRAELSPRHVPAKIIEVTEIPRTLNGKIVELAVREAVHGRDVPNPQAIANPQALEQFRHLPELAE